MSEQSVNIFCPHCGIILGVSLDSGRTLQLGAAFLSDKTRLFCFACYRAARLAGLAIDQARDNASYTWWPASKKAS